MNASFAIIDDNHVMVNNRKFKCTFIDENTINIESRLLSETMNDDVCNFLSNKYIRVDNGREIDLYKAELIKNSHITIGYVPLYYQSTYFEYYPRGNAYKEMKDKLDRKLPNGTTIFIEKYYLDSGVVGSMCFNKLHEKIESLRSGKTSNKIIFIHSNKLVGMDDCFEKYFDLRN